MGTKVEHVEDLAAVAELDDGADVLFEVTEVTTRRAFVSMRLGDVRRIRTQECARGGRRLADVDAIRNYVADRMAVIDNDELTTDESVVEFGDIEVI